MNSMCTPKRSFYGFLAISMLLCSISTAQSRKFSLSVNFSPIYSNSFNERSIAIPANQSTLINPVYTNSLTSYGYSFGLSAHYAFSSRWSATTGLWINNFVSAESTLSFDTDSYGPITNPSRIRIPARTYQIPLLANYRTSDKRLAAYFSAGMLINIPPVTTDYVIGYNNETGLLRGSRTDILPMIGAGISYQISNHFSLLAQPTLTLQFPPKDFVLYDAYRIGLLTQLKYTF